jgi:hypothetical protein
LLAEPLPDGIGGLDAALLGEVDSCQCYYELQSS